MSLHIYRGIIRFLTVKIFLGKMYCQVSSTLFCAKTDGVYFADLRKSFSRRPRFA